MRWIQPRCPLLHDRANAIKTGMADANIEAIEREIHRARFKESEAEGFLARRSRRRLNEASLQGIKDRMVRQAYLAGFKAGYEEPKPRWPLYAIGGVLSVCLLVIQVIG